MSNNYLSSILMLKRLLLNGDINGDVEGNFIFSRVSIGVFLVYRIFGVPFLIIQFKHNFKKKIYFLGLVSITIARKPLEVTEGHQYAIEKERGRRIYIHIGNLPYSDNRSGIPRVAKKLSEEGLKRLDLDVLPVYPDPRSGAYRIALNWIVQNGYKDPFLKGKAIDQYSSDPEMTIREGDWFIHTMINPYELEFENAHLQFMRENGVKIGFILHDIIAERHPEYFESRAARDFSRWLRKIGDFDGVFAVSQATQNDYKLWRKEQGMMNMVCPLKWFHLGADFKCREMTLNEKDKNLLDKIKEKEYYLQVSTIEPRKGHNQLLKSFECLWERGSELRLVLVGRKGWLVDDLCQKIRRHPQFGKRLFWLSIVSDELLAELYANAKGVIVASESEGFGLSVVEGAFYGKPLLLRDIPVFREIASNQAFYFEGKDAESLARSLDDMDDQLNKNMLNISMNKINYMSWSESFNQFQSQINV